MISERTPWVVPAVAAALWLTTLTLVLRSRLAFGAWPSYGAPDPAVFGLHHAAVMLLHPVALVAATLGFFVASSGDGPLTAARVRWQPAVLSAVLLGAYFAWAGATGVSEWLLD